MNPLLIMLVLLGILLEAIYIISEYRKQLVAAVILKGLASLAFVLLGVSAYGLGSGALAGALIVAGLVFGAIGDVLLNLRQLAAGAAARKVFVAGIAAFLVGHLLYIAALASLAPAVLLWAVPACALLSWGVLRYTLPRIEVQRGIKTFGILYVIVVLLMACCACILFATDPGRTAYGMFALGSLLFAASDILLVFFLFGKGPRRPERAVTLSLYYLGQLLIAGSVMVM